MFSPTHILSSRTKSTPVQLMAASGGYQLYTEADWRQSRTPAFELKPKQGIFCRGVQVVGFQLQPIESLEQSTESASGQISQVA